MRIHTFMHVPYEGLGCIEQWTNKNNHTVSYTKFYEKYDLPDVNEIDWLIVMGGPMGAYDESVYNWMSDEKKFIRKAVEKGKIVLGICLGSQLIAEVLGAKVYPNKQKEIGWFDLQLTGEGKKEHMLSGFEEKFSVFHWHGDTFDLPAGSTNLFKSEVTAHQAFLYKTKVLGLQFHFEVTAETLKGMVENGAGELIENNTIQTAEQILYQTSTIVSNNKKMFSILDYLSEI